MDDQVERVIEGGDRGHHPDRLGDREGPPALARGRQPHRDLASGADPQLVGSVAHPVDGSVGLNQRISQRLAAFKRDLATKMLALALHELGDPA